MFNIHMKENSCYMSLGQGQACNTLDRKGNHICFYGYRLFSLNSTFASMTLHTCEFPTAHAHNGNSCRGLECDKSKMRKMLKDCACLSSSWHLPECQVFFFKMGEEKVGLDHLLLTSIKGFLLTDKWFARARILPEPNITFKEWAQVVNVIVLWAWVYSSSPPLLCYSPCVIEGIFKTNVETVILQPDTGQGIESDNQC